MQAHPDRAARIAELALTSTAPQASSWRSVAMLVDVARGDPTIAPDQAQRFAEQALEVALAAEILTVLQTWGLVTLLLEAPFLPSSRASLGFVLRTARPAARGDAVVVPTMTPAPASLHE